MPLARISVPAHLAQERVIALADAVHVALVATCGVPPKDRFQLISRFAEGAMIIDPTFPDVERTADASIVEITFLAGRNDEKSGCCIARSLTRPSPPASRPTTSWSR